MFKKLYSKKGQVSMEIGILVAAAVVVSAIASYYYAVNVKYSDTHSGETAYKTSEAFLNVSANASEKISNITFN
uniref:Class III signal peptide n=1 Tax=Methanococcus maripaludis (strain C6 / ATCC BAA-1332) TaxID=444158 RepID=A9A776_METM6